MISFFGDNTTVISGSERPSRLKGIETGGSNGCTPLGFPSSSSERPSRLKGIET